MKRYAVKDFKEVDTQVPPTNQKQKKTLRQLFRLRKVERNPTDGNLLLSVLPSEVFISFVFVDKHDGFEVK